MYADMHTYSGAGNRWALGFHDLCFQMGHGITLTRVFLLGQQLDTFLELLKVDLSLILAAVQAHTIKLMS